MLREAAVTLNTKVEHLPRRSRPAYFPSPLEMRFALRARVRRFGALRM